MNKLNPSNCSFIASSSFGLMFNSRQGIFRLTGGDLSKLSGHLFLQTGVSGLPLPRSDLLSSRMDSATMPIQLSGVFSKRTHCMLKGYGHDNRIMQKGNFFVMRSVKLWLANIHICFFPFSNITICYHLQLIGQYLFTCC